MRIGISLLFCVCALGAPREEYKRNFQKTAPLSGGRTLRVDHSLGSVNVHTNGKSEVDVTASLVCSADRAADARTLCDAIQIRVEANANGILVQTDYPKQSSMHRSIGYSVNLDIAMPDSAPLDLRNRFGAVTVQNLHAPATVNNSNGNVVVTGGRGKQRVQNAFGTIEVLSTEGDIVVDGQNGDLRATDIKGSAELSNRFGQTRATNIARNLIVRGNNMPVEAEHIGGAIEITTSFGDVRVIDAKSDLTVRAQNGRVSANGVGGIADLRTTFADVKFTGITKGLTVRAENAQVSGDTVGESAVIETTFGGVDVRGVKGGARVTAQNSPIRLLDIGGEVYAKTSFASTTLENIGGPITVDSQNGSVTAAARPGPCKPIALRTTFAPIKVTVPSGIGYTVTAHTTFGTIRTDADFTVNGQIGEGIAQGKIAGGGCDLRLNGQNTDITISKR